MVVALNSILFSVISEFQRESYFIVPNMLNAVDLRKVKCSIPVRTRACASPLGVLRYGDRSHISKRLAFVAQAISIVKLSFSVCSGTLRKRMA